MFIIKDTDSFIKRAKEVHGDYYDYSKSVYTKGSDKIIIICPVHGEFSVRAGAHVSNPCGCNRCHRTVKPKRAGVIDRTMPSPIVGKRQCSNCREFYDISEFHHSNYVSDGLASWCKVCSMKKLRKWESDNFERVTRRQREYGKRKWIEYKELHKEELEAKREARRLYLIERKIIDGIGRNVRSRIRNFINGKSKSLHTIELLGCSYEKFKTYIESMFMEGMTWNNHTYYGWHLDHIIPCAFFDLTKEEECKKCFHYTNYQPLWRKPNQSKSSSYNGRSYGRNGIIKK